MSDRTRLDGSRFKTKTELVAARVRAAIRANEIAPGERIHIEKWAARLDVSPTPLREALQMLAAEGFVTQAPQRGFQAAAGTPIDLLVASQIRRAIHACASELVVYQLDAAARRCLADELRDLNARFREALEARDYELVNLANQSFHSLIIQHATSALLDRVRLTMEGLAVKDLSAYWESVEQSTDDQLQLVESHQRIIDAIEAGDAQRGASESWLHSQTTMMRVVSSLSDSLS